MHEGCLTVCVCVRVCIGNVFFFVMVIIVANCTDDPSSKP